LHDAADGDDGEIDLGSRKGDGEIGGGVVAGKGGELFVFEGDGAEYAGEAELDAEDRAQAGGEGEVGGGDVGVPPMELVWRRNGVRVARLKPKSSSRVMSASTARSPEPSMVMGMVEPPIEKSRGTVPWKPAVRLRRMTTELPAPKSSMLKKRALGARPSMDSRRDSRELSDGMRPSMVVTALERVVVTKSVA